MIQVHPFQLGGIYVVIAFDHFGVKMMEAEPRQSNTCLCPIDKGSIAPVKQDVRP
jgi:hypothetical protein